MSCECGRYVDSESGLPESPPPPAELYAYKRYPAGGTIVLPLFDQSYESAVYTTYDTNLMMPGRLLESWEPFAVGSVRIAYDARPNPSLIAEQEMATIAAYATISLHTLAQCWSAPPGHCFKGPICLKGKFIAYLEWPETLAASAAFSIGLHLIKDLGDKKPGGTVGGVER